MNDLNSDSNKMSVSIYKIDTESQILADSTNKFDELKQFILSKGFSIQTSNPNYSFPASHEICIFYKQQKGCPKWKDFLSESVQSGSAILEDNKSWNENFIILLKPTDSSNIYAITGGTSPYHTIQNVLDNDFGINVVSCLIKKDEKIIKSIKEKSLMGGVLGSNRFFRKNYNLYENDGFGKIYQELKANLDKELLIRYFGFTDQELKKSSICVAKSSFAINKAIQFKKIFKIVSGCEYILQNPDELEELKPITINKVRKITKKETTLIEKLDSELLKQLWNRYQNSNYEIDFDLCHKDFDKYLTASTYVVRKNSSKKNYFNNNKIFDNDEPLENADILFTEIKSQEEDPLNEASFFELINSLNIYTYDNQDETSPLTKGSLKSHIFGDVSLTGNEKRFFLIDNNWYEVQSDFINDLNESCSSFINKNYNELLDKKWNYPTDSENFYNKSYIGVEHTIVLDKITPENIESCDLLKWDEKNIYLYHVKSGFGNTMRDLCSQVFIAATKFQEDKNSYIQKIYEDLFRKKTSTATDPYFREAGAQTDNITQEEFKSLFNKNMVFVLAVLDSGTSDRSLKTNIVGYNSNIAKFSLQELSKGMKGLDISLEFTQILKESI